MFTMTEVANRVRTAQFVPMRLVTSSGESYEIRHPDNIMVGRREVIIGIGRPDEPRFYERITRVSMLHITAIEDLPTDSAQSPNGQA